MNKVIIIINTYRLDNTTVKSVNKTHQKYILNQSTIISAFYSFFEYYFLDVSILCLFRSLVITKE